jgi:hypothetical protein
MRPQQHSIERLSLSTTRPSWFVTGCATRLPSKRNKLFNFSETSVASVLLQAATEE